MSERLSSQKSAKLYGVTNDYIARLCRNGKVAGVLENRTWMVDQKSLAEFFARQGKTPLREGERGELLTSREAARLYRVTNDYVARLCRQGKLDGVFANGIWKVRKSSLDTFFAPRREAVVASEPTKSVELAHTPTQPVFRKVFSQVSFAEQTIPRNKKFAFAAGVVALVVVANAVALAGTAFHSASPAAVASLQSPFFGGDLISKIFSSFFGTKVQEEPTQIATPNYQTNVPVASAPVQPMGPVMQTVYQTIARTSSDSIPTDTLLVMLGELHKSVRGEVSRMINATLDADFFSSSNSGGGSGGLALADLTDANIPDTITASNYLPLAGGTLTGALSGTSATFSGTASSSALIVSGLNSANCDVKASATGVLSCGSDSTGAGGGDFPFTPTAWGNSTSTTIGFTNGLIANASSTFAAGLNFTNFSNGSLAVNSSGGVYTAATTTFSAPLVYSNGNVTLTQSGASTDGYLSSTDWNLFNNKVSSSSLATLLTSAYPFPLTGNATSTLTQFNGGLTAYASSTIGGGTQTTGLTVNGGATTTGSAYIAGSLGIGVSAPNRLLNVVGGTNTTETILAELRSNHTGPGTGTSLRFTNSTSPGAGNGASEIAAVRYTDGISGNMFIRTANSSAVLTDRISIFGITGNVGIGSSTPTYRLSVEGESSLGNIARAGYFIATSTTASTFPFASTTAMSGTISQFTTASSTNLTISSINSALLKTLADGTVAAAVAGTDYATPSQITGAFPFTPTTAFGTAANATSTLIGFTNGIYALASSTIGNGTQTGGLTVNGGATTTGNEYIAGTSRIGGLGGGYILGVAGSTGISGTLSLMAAGLDSGNRGAFAFTDSTGNLNYTTSGGTGQHITFNQTGNFGIGTTSPSTLLSLAGSTGLFASTTATSTFQGGGINLLTAAGNTGCFAVNGTCLSTTASGIVGSGTTGQFPYYAANGTTLTATSSLFITTSGNVGIGTAGPTQRLHVSSGVMGAPVTSGATQTNGTMRLRGNDNGILDQGFLAGGGGAWFQSTDQVSLDLSYPILLNPNGGNVGIGDASPAARLTVGSGDLFQVDSSGRLLLPAGAAGAGNLALSTTGDTNTGLYFSAADEIRIQTGGSDRVTINSSGNVGVGTTSPYTTLSVNGNVGISGNLGVANITATGTVATANLTVGTLNGLLKATAGVVSAAVAGTDYVTPSGLTSAFPFTPTTAFGSSANATSTLIGFTNGIYSLASSTIGGGTATTGLTINGGATTTANAYFGGLIGVGQQVTSAEDIMVLTNASRGYISVNRTTGGSAGLKISAGSSNSSYIYQQDSSNDLSFYVNSADRLYISSAGNVGIGTTTPGTRLAVEGESLLGNGATAGYFVATTTTSNRFPFASTTAISGTNATFTGNVGINSTGVTSAKLDVRTSGAGNVAMRLIADSFETAFRLSENSTFSNVDFAAVSGGSLRVDNAGYVVFNNTGNVGLGSTTPYSKLSVQKNYGNTGSSLFTVASSTASDGSTATTYLTVSDAGKVGVRTNSPGAYLAVNGSGVIGLANQTAYDVGAGTIGAGTSIYSYGSICTNNNSGACDGANGVVIGASNTTAYTNITSSGNSFFGGRVGFGTTTTSRTLQAEAASNAFLVYTSGVTNSSTSAAPTFVSPKGTVSMFIGSGHGTNSGQESVASYGVDESSGNIRFNGTSVAWGDFGYYPNGGGNGNYGNFRLSLAGSTIDTVPDAKLGVGSLYSAGNIGIGTTTPQQSLTINNTSGSATIGSWGTASTNAASDVIVANSIGGAFQYAQAKIQVQRTSSLGQGWNFLVANNSAGTISEAMRITSEGLVGIGTSTPTWLLNPTSATAAQLSLSAGAGFAQWAFRNAGGNLYLATTTVAGTATTTTSALTINGLNGHAFFSSNVGFATSTASSTIELPGTGSIGFSTQGTSGRVELSNLTGALLIRNPDTTTNNTSFRLLPFTTGIWFQNTNTSGEINFSGLNGASLTGDILFRTTAEVGFGTTTPWGRMSVDSSSLAAGIPSFVVGSSTRTDLMVTQAGHVGIGTNSPQRPLHIASSGSPTTVWEQTSNGTDLKKRFITNGSLGQMHFGKFNDSMSVSTIHLTLDTDGNLLPNTDNTQDFGSTALRWDCLYYDATVLGTCASDERLKNSIEDFSFGESPLTQLSGLRPRTFEMNDAPGLLSYGLVAQEVQAVAPDLVEVGEDGYLQVRYGRIQYLTIEAIKEMHLNFETIASSTASSTPESESFAERFMSGIFARMTAWLADAGNGIANLFAATITAETVYAKNIHASETICVDGECLTKDDIRNILQVTRGSSSNTPSADPEPTPEPEPAPEETPNETPDEETSGEIVTEEDVVEENNSDNGTEGSAEQPADGDVDGAVGEPSES